MVDLPRRGFVTGALAVLGAAAVDALSGVPTAQAQTPAKNKEADFVKVRVLQRGSHSQFGDALKATSRAHEGRSNPGKICFGMRDSSHLELTHRDPLLDPANQEIAKATGYGMLSIELPVGMRDIVNKLWNSGGTDYDLTVFKGEYIRFMVGALTDFNKTGIISADDIKVNGFTVADMHSWGSVIIAAKKAGIPVYMNDPQPVHEIIQNLLDIETLLKNPRDSATFARVSEHLEKRISIYDPEAARLISEQMDRHKTNSIHFGGDLHFRLRAGDTFKTTGLPVKNLDDSLREKGIQTPTLLVMAIGDPKVFHENGSYLKQNASSPYPPHPSQEPDMYYSVSEARLHVVDTQKYPLPRPTSPKSQITPLSIEPN